MNVIKDTLIPNIFASKCSGKFILKGNLLFERISPIVVEPPSNILQKAAIGLLFFQNKAPKTGTNNPETIKA